MGPDPFNPSAKDKPIVIKTRVPHGTELICVSGSQVPGKNCEQAADGVTLEKDPFTRKRKLILWTVDEQLESAAQGAEATRTMWMKVMVKKKRKAIRAKAIAKEFTLRSTSKARALTVIEIE